MANETINFLIDDDQEIVSFNTGEGTTTDFLSGDGTPSYLPKYESGQILGDSIVYENTGVGIIVEGELHTGIATAPVSGSTVTMVTDSSDTVYNVGSVFNVNRVLTADTPSAATHGGLRKVTSDNTFADGGIIGGNDVGRQSGTGGAYYVYGSMIKGEQSGSGDIDFLNGVVATSKSIGDGTGTIDYMRAISTRATQENTTNTVNFLQGAHLTAAIDNATAGTVEVLLLDFDRVGGTITNDFTYLQIQEDAGAHTVGGTARSIWSRNTLPSEFSGSISTPLLLNESESVLTSGYAYGTKSKVTNKQTSGAPSIIASRAEASIDTDVNSGAIYGTNTKAMSYGTGDASFLIGTYSTSENMNEGNVTSGMYGTWSQSRSRGAAVVNISHMYGSINKAMTNNANSTTTAMVGMFAETDLTAGTITDEVNVIEAKINGTGAIVGGDLSMLKIDNSSIPASIAGTARAINSEVDLPSYFEGAIGIGTNNPSAKLEVDGGIKMADDASVASATKEGTQRYRKDANNSYVDMCMQTGATTYEWINITQNNW